LKIYIEKLQVMDAENLLEFEVENRAFFEEMVPTRGDDYYIPEFFMKKHEAMLEEQALGISLFYLIKNQEGEILGRINVVDLDATNKVGHLGYRVGQIYTGKGVANQALKLLLETLADTEIKQIEAKTTTNNIASQKVLEKNGFERVAGYNEEFEIEGKKLSFIHYIWVNEWR